MVESVRLRLFLAGLWLLGAPLAAQAPKPVVTSAPPQGAGLMVTPTRLILDSRKRSAELSLFNAGADTATYRLGLVRVEMDEQGQFRELPLNQEPGRVHPQDLIRFAPKEVTMGPREWQTVRVQVHKPADLPPGEYRVNLSFRVVPTPEANDPDGPAPSGIAIRLTPIWGVTVPLIVRHGDTAAQVALEAPVLDPEAKTLTVRVTRTGNQSVYGDLRATFVPDSGPEQLVAAVQAVAVYPPNAGRIFKMPLGPGPWWGGSPAGAWSSPTGPPLGKAERLSGSVS